jgi:hypothetical protein
MPCPICNDFEGWESPAKARGEQALKSRSKPFHMKTTIEGLVGSAISGCVICSILHNAVAHFFPGVNGEEKLEGWIPIQPHFLNLVMKSNNHDNFTEGSFIQFYTAPGNLKPSC